jgi:hypothetical protein
MCAVFTPPTPSATGLSSFRRATDSRNELRMRQWFMHHQSVLQWACGWREHWKPDCVNSSQESAAVWTASGKGASKSSGTVNSPALRPKVGVSLNRKQVVQSQRCAPSPELKFRAATQSPLETGCPTRRVDFEPTSRIGRRIHSLALSHPAPPIRHRADFAGVSLGILSITSIRITIF